VTAAGGGPADSQAEPKRKTGGFPRLSPAFSTMAASVI